MLKNSVGKFFNKENQNSNFPELVIFKNQIIQNPILGSQTHCFSSGVRPSTVGFANTNSQGFPNTRKLTFDIVVLLMSVVLKSTLSSIVILYPKLHLLPDGIVTYNLDFRGFWLSKGETTIFQKKQNFIFEFNFPKTKMSR